MRIISKKSKIYSTLNLKCPRCHEGDLFETGSFSFQKPFDMPKQCSHCGQSYWPEPGFYYGAMFISYIFTGWFCLFFVMFFHWVLDWGLAASFGLLIAVCTLFFIYIFRLARSVWINLNVKYKP
jgi:uncharacterized protein (DUF983 family)